jgi:hypothetical protein
VATFDLVLTNIDRGYAHTGVKLEKDGLNYTLSKATAFNRLHE